MWRNPYIDFRVYLVIGFLRLITGFITKTQREFFVKNYQWTQERKFYTGFVILLVVLTVVGVRYINNYSSNKLSNLGGKKIEVQGTTPPIDPAVLATDKIKLSELKKKFTYSYDEFKDVGWYDNKSQNVDATFDKKLLKVSVNNNGYAYLSDQYYGDDWIFHTRVEVKIGDTVYKTDDIPSYDSNNHKNNSSGSVWETIDYTKDRDNGIIKAIAESGDATIKVRFTGGEYYDDITLAKRDQQAIKDAYELSQLIQEVGDTKTKTK